jgi:hypothetical protein
MSAWNSPPNAKSPSLQGLDLSEPTPEEAEQIRKEAAAEMVRRGNPYAQRNKR